MKPLLILSMLITACNSKPEKPKEIWIPYNSTDTFIGPGEPHDTINLVKDSATNEFHFMVDSKEGSDTLIVENGKKVKPLWPEQPK